MQQAMYAVVEIMGRDRIAGMVSEELVADVKMLRIDVPDSTHTPGFTRYLSTTAIYSITPVDAETAQQVADHLAKPQVSPWLLSQVSHPELSESFARDFDDAPGDELWENGNGSF